jgi:hypothetical protein
MATLIPFACFATDIEAGQHLLETDVLKMALSSGEYDPDEEEYKPIPLNKTNWNSTDFVEPYGSLSYPNGGYTLEKVKYIEKDGVYSLFLKNLTFDCPENEFFGPFRYLIIYNHTISDRLIGYYDYGSVVSLIPSQTFFVDFDPDKIIPAIRVDTTGGTPSPTPTPTPTPSPIPPAGISFLNQTGTGSYAGTYTGIGLEGETTRLKVTMLSDGTTKYMNFISGSNGKLYYYYEVNDPDKVGATASMAINGYQQGAANRRTGLARGSVIVKAYESVVFSFNAGYIPEGKNPVASSEFTAYIVED